MSPSGSPAIADAPAVECVASPDLMPRVLAAARDALSDAGIESRICAVPVGAPPSIETLAGAINVIGRPLARRARVRAIAGCDMRDAAPRADAFVIGLDRRVPAEWQTSAFLGTAAPAAVRSALYRLILDPTFTGPVDAPRDRDRIAYGEAFRRTLRHRLTYDLPPPEPPAVGRILWVDANPTVDSVLDPYGLSILNEVCRRHGFLGLITCPFTEFERPEEALTNLIARFGPDMIGLSVRNLDDAVSVRTMAGRPDSIDVFDNLPAIRRLTAAIHACHEGPVIVGGAALTRAPRSLMDALNVDFGVQGPGEEVVRALLRQWTPAGDPATSRARFIEAWAAIPGTLRRNADGEVTSPPSSAARELRTPRVVPRDPARLWAERRLGIATAVRGSYGCPLNCGYCLEATPRVRVARRDAEHIVDEMEWLLNQYGICAFHLTDSEANFPFSRMRSLAASITRRGLGRMITWTAYATPAPFDLTAVSLLSDSGLRALKVTVDHFAPQQLRALGRAHREPAVHRFLAGVIEQGNPIGISASILFGGPGETLASVDYAVRWMREYAAAGISFYYNVGLRVYPGTPLFDQWMRGDLDPAACFGPGRGDGGVSPLVYCSPLPPRTLARRVADALAHCPNVWRIAPQRPRATDESLRLLHVALASWQRGDFSSASSALDAAGVEIPAGARIGSMMSTAFRLENRLRRAMAPA